MTCSACERGLTVRGPRTGTRIEPVRRANGLSRGIAGQDIPPGFPTTCQCHVQLIHGDPDGGGLPVPCYFDVSAWSGVAGETLARFYPYWTEPIGGGTGGVAAGGSKFHPAVEGYRVEFPDEPDQPNLRHVDGPNAPSAWFPVTCDENQPFAWFLGRFQWYLDPIVSGGVLTGWEMRLLFAGPNDGPYVATYSLNGWDPYTDRTNGVLSLASTDAGFAGLREAYDTDPENASGVSLPASIELRPRCFDSGCSIQTSPGVFDNSGFNPCYANLGSLTTGPAGPNDPGPTVWSTPYTPPESPPTCLWNWDGSAWSPGFSNCSSFPNSSCGPAPVCDGPAGVGPFAPVDAGCFSTR